MIASDVTRSPTYERERSREASRGHVFVARAPLLLGVVVALLAALLYTLTLAPSVMPGDYAEFQMSTAVLGVPHPTGYPLYIMLGKLFTLLPFGDVAYRVNFSSAIYMAGAVGVLYAVGVRLLRVVGLGRVWWAAAVGAALFAASPTVWSMALVARSYALNALLVGCVVYALLTWCETGRARWFYGSCVLVGLSMVHHGTTYLLLPAYGVYFLLVEAERRRGGTKDEGRKTKGGADKATSRFTFHVSRKARYLLGALALLVGLSPMLFLVGRFVWGAPYYWGNPTTWKDFFNLLTGGPFHNQVMGFGWDTQLERVGFGLGELVGQYTLLGVVVGVVGLVALWRARRGEAALLTLMMVGNFLFAMNYSLVGYLYFIPTYLLWGVLVAVGVGRLAHWLLSLLAGPLPGQALLVGPATLSLVFVGALYYMVALRYPNIDQSGQTATRDEALALLSAAPQGAALYMDWEDVSVIRFYRMVYGMRPDLTLHTGDPADWPKGVYCALESGGAAYVGEFAGEQPPVVARDFVLEGAPMGWRVVSAQNATRYAWPPCGACATCR